MKAMKHYYNIYSFVQDLNNICNPIVNKPKPKVEPPKDEGEPKKDETEAMEEEKPDATPTANEDKKESVIEDMDVD